MPSGPLAFVVSNDKSRSSTSSSEQRSSGGHSLEIAFENLDWSLILRGGILVLKHSEKKVFKIDALALSSVMTVPQSSLKVGILESSLVRTLTVFQKDFELEGCRPAKNFLLADFSLLATLIYYESSCTCSSAG